MTKQTIAERNNIYPESGFKHQLSITKKLIIDYKSQIIELKKQESTINPSLFRIKLSSLNNLLKEFEKEYQELLLGKIIQ